MSYLYMIIFFVIGLLMTTSNRVSSWIVWVRTIEKFEVLIVDAIWGGSWVVITAIMWIARPCVAYWVNSAELLCFLTSYSISGMKRTEFPPKTDRFRAKSLTTDPCIKSKQIKLPKQAQRLHAIVHSSTGHSPGVHQP